MKVVFNGGDYQELTITDETGQKPQNMQMIIVASSGHGKSVMQETITEKYHNNGFLVIHLTDVKDEFEPAFAMFKPTNKVHLKQLNLWSKTPASKKVKIYHPFTFKIPPRKLPDINFFTFSIKNLGLDEFSYILETESHNDAVLLLQNVKKDLEPTDGIYDFMHRLDQAINPGEFKTISKLAKPNPKHFFLRSAHSGTAKTISDIASHFVQFNEHYYLQPDNCETNIDFKELLSDQEHYHVLTTVFIPEEDKKTKYFAIFNFFNELYKNLEHAKHPILIVIEEARVFIPAKTNEHYINKMAVNFRDKLSKFRSKGKGGVTTIGTSQVYFDIAEEYRKTSTVQLLGRLEITDVKSLANLGTMSKDVKTSLLGMPRNDYYMLGFEGMWSGGFPCHAHKEENDKFEMLYRKHFKEKMKSYRLLVKQFEFELNQTFKKYKELSTLQYKKEQEELIKKAKKDNKEKQEENDEYPKPIKVKVKKEDKKEKLKRKLDLALACLKEREMGHTLTQIAKRHNISHTSVANLEKLARSYLKKKEENN